MSPPLPALLLAEVRLEPTRLGAWLRGASLTGVTNLREGRVRLGNTSYVKRC